MTPDLGQPALDPELHLKRVTLRRFSRRDGPALCALLAQLGEQPLEPGRLPEESLHLALVRERDPCFWAACLGGAQGAFLGQLALSPLEGWPKGFWELGYGFLQQYRRQGYAAESCRGLLAYAFGALGAQGVAAFCGPENRPSARLLEKLGFRNQGLRENLYCRADSQGIIRWQSALVYQLTKRQWQRGQS